MDRDPWTKGGAKRKPRLVGPRVEAPTAAPLSSLVADAPNPRQPLEPARVGPRGDVWRRSLPPPRTTTVRRSPQRRWRERPRCAAQRLTRGRRDGLVHAIGCLRRVSPDTSHVSSGRSRATACSVRGRFSAQSTRVCKAPRLAHAGGQCARKTRLVPITDERTTIASTMLAPCSVWSMLSASLRPGPWPGLWALTTLRAAPVGEYAMVASGRRSRYLRSRAFGAAAP